jgi:uncharacterized membrane protein
MKPWIRKQLIALIVTIPLLAVPMVAQLQTLKFSLVDLGLMGGAQTKANGINSSGQVAGDIVYSDGHSDCFLWSFRGTITWTSVLQAPIAMRYCDAHGIDDAGSVVGTIRRNMSGFPFHGFRRTPTGTLVDLKPDVPNMETHGRGIDPSGSGVTVGASYDFPIQPIRWDSSGNPTVLPSAFGYGGAFGTPVYGAYAINSAGTIVGESCGAIQNLWCYLQVFEWSAPSFAPTQIGLVSDYSVVNAINAKRSSCWWL